MREFIVGALKNEMGLAMANDPDLVAAQSGPVTTAGGMKLNGLVDRIEQAPPDEGDIGTVEQRTALVDFLEFYLLNYFKPGDGERTHAGKHGRRLFEQVGCASCHVPTLRIDRDRRVADVETRFDPVNGTLQSPVRDRDAAAGEPVVHRTGRASPRSPPSSRSSSRTSTPTSSGTISDRRFTSGATTARCARSS